MPLSRIGSAREVTSLVIRAGTTWDVTVPASDGERVVNQFRTEIGDLNFESLFLPGATSRDNIYKLSSCVTPVVVQAQTRCKSMQVVYEPDEPGVLLLRFDNQHSWARSKTCTVYTETIARPQSPPEPAALQLEQPPSKMSLEEKIDEWLSVIPIGGLGCLRRPAARLTLTLLEC